MHLVDQEVGMHPVGQEADITLEDQVVGIVLVDITFLFLKLIMIFSSLFYSA